MITIFVSVILLALFVYLYIKERKTPGYKAPLIIRFIVLILLILILIGTIVKFTYQESPKIPVLVLVDASRSINYRDNLMKIESIVNKINKMPFAKKFYAFTDSVKPWQKEAPLIGEKTDIGQALLYASTQKPGAVILISDGQHNQKNDPYSIARNSLAPIYTIGLSSAQQKDLLIKSISKPLQTFLGDTIEITVRIQSQTFENQTSKVHLIRKGKTIASQDILITVKDAYQEVKFNITPETIGKVTYSVVIDNLPDEDNTANNRKDFTLQVLKNRWQILYLTNSPSLNTRFITASLQNLNSEQAQQMFSITPIIAFVGRKYEILTKQSIDQVFKNIDVVILDNVNELNLTADLINRLQNLLEQGKGFLVLTGENFNPQTFLKDILPLQYSAAKTINKDLFFEPTDNSAKLPLFYNQTNQYLLDNTPPLWGLNLPDNIKPNTVVWLQTKGDKTPLMSYQMRQKSKVVLFNGFPIWRFAFSSIETESRRQNFDQFLANLLRFLAISELDNFKLITDKPDYLTGEQIIINLLANTPDARPFTGADVRINIPNLKTAIPLYEISAGTYQAEIEAAQQGQYQLTANIYKDTQKISTVQTTINITPQTIEDITGLDADLMRKIASQSNGKFFSADEFLNQEFNPELAVYQKTINISLKNNPYVYVLITLLFSTLLYLRKKRGLL